MEHKRSIQYAAGVICPYCLAPLRLPQGKLFGITACNCNHYPVIAGIINIYESPDLINRRLGQLIQGHRFDLAVWRAITGARRHKIIVFSAYLLSEKLHLHLPINWLLKLLIFSGPSRSWFKYLLHRSSRSEIQLFTDLSNRHQINYTSTADIGCGIGSLYKIFPTVPPHYIGIDKSFLSLLIFRLSHPSVTLVCADIETGLPLAQNSQSTILIMDTFSLLKSKPQVLSQISRALSTGLAYFGNIYPETPETYNWGYGISQPSLKLIAKKHFSRLVFYPQSVPPRYTCLAFKK